MQIRQLEDELGTPIFTRTPRRVILTEAGERLLTRARKILAEHDQFFQKLPNLPARVWPPAYWLGIRNVHNPPAAYIMQHLRETFPNAELTVNSGKSAGPCR